MRIFKIELVVPTSVGEAVYPEKLIGKHVVKHHVAQTAATLSKRIGLRERRKAECHQHLQRRDLGLGFFPRIEATFLVH